MRRAQDSVLLRPGAPGWGSWVPYALPVLPACSPDQPIAWEESRAQGTKELPAPHIPDRPSTTGAGSLGAAEVPRWGPSPPADTAGLTRTLTPWMELGWLCPPRDSSVRVSDWVLLSGLIHISQTHENRMY